jgi:hypothetical protein
MKQLAINPGKPDSTPELAEPGGAVGETIMANQETKTPRVMGVGHVALSARDPVALAEFYRDVLGLQVVPTESSDLGNRRVSMRSSTHTSRKSSPIAMSTPRWRPWLPNLTCTAFQS